MTDPNAPGGAPGTTRSPRDGAPRISTGIAPLDQRTGGVERGGSYLVVGPAGPAKLVAVLQFLRAGLQEGETCVLVTGADPRSVLFAARGWGVELDSAWRDGSLQLLGFRDDFELRAARSIAPEEVLEELDIQAGPGVDRIAVDPGGYFLSGDGRTLLGGAFLRWAREHRATVCTTLTVEGESGNLPATGDWMVHGTTGRLVLTPRAGGLLQGSLVPSIPHGTVDEAPVSLQLKPRVGLVKPDAFPSRRGVDRGPLDPGRLLLVSLGGSHARDLEAWARGAFQAEVVSRPFEAVSRVQADESFGTVLIYAARDRVREAVEACRALRPLTRSALVFASDDQVRSGDRVLLLEAGADDCLSGGVDFRELSLRIRQAMASGAPPRDRPLPETPGIPRGGEIALDAFREEVRRRSGDPEEGVFCLLKVAGPSRELHPVLVGEVRDEDGDLVARNGEGSLVLLQGARESHTAPFLARVRERLGDGGGALAVEVRPHPGDEGGILQLLEESGGDVS